MQFSSYKKTIKGDLTGGLTAAIIALPMGLAFGLQSGLGAEAGMYTAIILAIIAASVGGTKTLISDPTGPMTIVAATVVYSAISLPNNESLNDALPIIIATFALAGIFQILFGLINVSKYVKYISYPVLSGFMGGIGIIIILFQWHNFFGEKTPKGIINIISHLPEPVMHHHWSSIFLGGSTLLLIYIIPLISKKIPAGLIALIIVTSISIFMDHTSFLVIGKIPSQMPSLKIDLLTSLKLADLSTIIVSALTLAGLGTIDTLLTAVVADNITKTKHNGNRELIGQGLGNFVAALFGGFPGAGSTTGTVANINSNGKTKFSGIFKGCFLIIILFGFSNYVKVIPVPVLSALLISVGIGIIDFKGIKRLIKLKNSDSFVLVIVILITIFADLLIAVGVGMVFSSFFFMQKMGEIVDQRSKKGALKDVEKSLKIPDKLQDKIYDFELDGPLFYGFSDQFKSHADSITDKEAVIINIANVPYIDASGIYVLEEIIADFKLKAIEVVVVGINEHIYQQFEELELIPTVLAEENAYNSVRAGLKYLKYKLEK
ncbi:MAG: SulP family inorganic anion transporter [Parvicellaceae bacterium]